MRRRIRINSIAKRRSKPFFAGVVMDGTLFSVMSTSERSNAVPIGREEEDIGASVRDSSRTIVRITQSTRRPLFRTLL
ncbi:hypothetical protein R1flu_009888 [Riccia fluitans]|uniref:Uncharacterized protein n=1 Tax=Riccia fluitans TaxID=41844 RepID=A0ABD1Z3R5_9MARC